MANPVSNSTILMNVGVQAFNLFLFFLIFYFGFAKKISEGLKERKDLIFKLQYADDEYKNIVASAENAANEIISDANSRKKSIIDESTILAKQKAELLMEEANNKANSIMQTAQVRANILETDIKQNYEVMIKTTAGGYLKKIFDTDPEMQNAYMEKVIKGIL